MDDIAIPDFLQRNKQEKNQSENIDDVSASPQAEDETPQEKPVTLDEIMERLKKLKEQRDKINEAIAAHKRVAKKLIQEM